MDASAYMTASHAMMLQVQLQRERLELSPVFSTAMQHGGHTTGYIRLINFSQKAAPEMRHAIAELQVSLYIDEICAALRPGPACGTAEYRVRVNGPFAHVLQAQLTCSSI